MKLMSETIVNSLFTHAQSLPNKMAFRYLQDLESLPQELSYLELWQSAAAVADFLKKIARPGSRIMLFFPPGLAYVKAFYGCLLADMVAVPLYPPRRNAKSDRVIGVAQSCQSSIALTTESELANIQSSWEEQNSLGLPLHFYATDIIPALNSVTVDCPEIDPATPAFLQYTSGSTGTPKGVLITHGNIIANVKHLSLMAKGTKEDIFVNWLPLFHDFGLITAVLWPVYLSAPSTLMAPATFVRNPSVWLKAINRYRGTMCGAPNFAYDLCTTKITDVDLSLLDLSCWRVAYNAAEPVRAKTLNDFFARFAQCKFKAEAFYPGYGMAEATVFIAGGDPSIKPLQLSVNRKAIAENKFELMDASDPMSTTMVACGTALPPHNIRIVDPETGCELSEGSVGEIWFSGPSVSPGYLGLEELSAANFNQKIIDNGTASGGYFKTGDLGVIWRGDLFVTGRIKDLIILHGRNYYPQDIEASAVAAHPALRWGYCTAFSVSSDQLEQLIIVAEVEREHVRTIDVDQVVDAIRYKVAQDHELSVSDVVLLKPYKLPVTSSGKVQRKLTRQLFLNKTLNGIAPASSTSHSSYVAPRVELEYLLCDIWGAALNRTQIGINDNFFDLGGNSLVALEISTEIRKKINVVDIDATQLFEYLTIEKLVKFLEIKIAHEKNKENEKNQQNYKVVRI
jgi:acyl-CoA synthetase (AMP-forming)/AMP-acid ligase II/acyl carrier protein